ncbi:MAG: sigma-70 family RNA polymerase sigma factor [Acidimicrobiia bacterium]|nr:sigma-70 family RNA polymerase sigma factor [Acidimicrobiia bacterium]
MVTGGVRQDERTDSELVLAVRGQGPDAANPDPDAFGVLFDRWYDRCWNVARNIMRSDDLAAEVAQDAMLAGWQRLDQLHNPEAFGGWLLRITRNRALTRLEREGRSRATGDDIVSAMRDRNISQSHDEPLGAQAPPSVETAMEIHDRQELVWAASAALGERDASLLDLHLRHGLTPAEIAEELGVEANAAHQQLFRLRNKLGDAIGSYLLWRNGRTLCRGLAAAVSGEVAFDRSVARAVAKHQKICEECAERRARLVSPTKLFASVPFLVVPFQFKVDAAAALAEAGVPVDPSTIAAAGPSGPPAGPSQGPTGPSQGSTGQGSTGQGSGGTGSGTPGTGEPTVLIRSTPTPSATTPIPEPTTGYAILGSDAPPDLPGPTAPAHDATVRHGFSNGLGWTTARSAWLKSLGGAIAVMLLGLALIGLLPGLAISDLWPFGGENSSIGSETLAGPAINETSTTEATDGVAAAPGDPTDADAESASADPTDLAERSSTVSTSGPTRATTPATTPTRATPTSTLSTTATIASTTSSSTTASTTATTPTTATTTDTSRTTSTDRDTTSSSSTTETTETTQPPPPPRIVRFTSRPVNANIRCNSRNDRTYEAIWATENTESVELFLPNGASVTGKPNGVQAFCGQPGNSISLLASGPGGSDKASTTLG